MFQLACGISLRMNVGYFLQFQSALHGKGIIQSSSDKENVFGRNITIGKFLNVIPVSQKHFNLIRQPFQILDHISDLFPGNRASDLGEFDRQQIFRDQLGAECLCCSHGDLRSRPSIDHFIRFSCNGASHHIYDSQRHRAFFFCFPQGSQGIRRFSGLADDDHQIVFPQDRIAVTELTGQIHERRDPCHFFKNVFGAHAGIACGTACHNVDAVDPADLIVCHAQLVDHDLAVFQSGFQRIPHRFGLFIHLFQHEMLIAAFFRRVYIPFYRVHFFFDFFFINIVKSDPIFFQHRDLFVLDIINIPCVFQDRRHIRSDQIAFFSFSHYERAVFSK